MLLMFTNFFGMFATLFNAGNNVAIAIENLSTIGVAVSQSMVDKATSDRERHLLKYQAKLQAVTA